MSEMLLAPEQTRPRENGLVGFVGARSRREPSSSNIKRGITSCDSSDVFLAHISTTRDTSPYHYHFILLPNCQLTLSSYPITYHFQDAILHRHRRSLRQRRPVLPCRGSGPPSVHPLLRSLRHSSVLRHRCARGRRPGLRRSTHRPHKRLRLPSRVRRHWPAGSLLCSAHRKYSAPDFRLSWCAHADTTSQLEQGVLCNTPTGVTD